MLIRFKEDHQEGSVQFFRSQPINLPRALATQFVDDNLAVEIPKAERAIVHAKLKGL